MYVNRTDNLSRNIVSSKRYWFGYATITTCVAALLSLQVSFAADGGLTGSTGSPDLPIITPVITDSQVGTIGAANCAQQLDDLMFGLDLAGLTAEAAGLGAASAATAAAEVEIALDVVALIAEEVAVIFRDSAPPITTVPGVIAEKIAVVAQITAAGAAQVAVGIAATELGIAAAGIATQATAATVNQVASGLPNCNSTFTGSVVVEAGGIDVTGNSKVDGDFGVSGSFIARKGEFGQGISTYTGQLILGDSSLNSFFAGITIGGGELAGAGTGGTDSFTGDVNAIAIGNGSSAANAGGIALGLLANSAATDAVAIGSRTSAAGTSSVALGNNASATMTNAAAVGASSSATGVGSLALGTNSSSSALNAIAIGTASVVSANNATAFGQGATSAFENSTAVGTGATTLVNNQIVLGTAAQNITTPGIVSALSASRQTGKLSLATTDDGGNLAFDGGGVFTEIANNRQGIAIALAAQDPDLVAGEKGSIAINIGNFKDAYAMAFNIAGVLSSDNLMEGSTLTINAAIGASLGRPTFYTRESDFNFGGRVNLKYRW